MRLSPCRRQSSKVQIRAIWSRTQHAAGNLLELVQEYVNLLESLQGLCCLSLKHAQQVSLSQILCWCVCSSRRRSTSAAAARPQYRSSRCYSSSTGHAEGDSWLLCCKTSLLPNNHSWSRAIGGASSIEGWQACSSRETCCQLCRCSQPCHQRILHQP